jgi:hypothetical protein
MSWIIPVEKCTRSFLWCYVNRGKMTTWRLLVNWTSFRGLKYTRARSSIYSSSNEGREAIALLSAVRTDSPVLGLVEIQVLLSRSNWCHVEQNFTNIFPSGNNNADPDAKPRHFQSRGWIISILWVGSPHNWCVFKNICIRAKYRSQTCVESLVSFV